MVLSLSNAIRLFQSDNIDFDWNPKVDGFASTSCQMFDIRFPFFLKIWSQFLPQFNQFSFHTVGLRRQAYPTVIAVFGLSCFLLILTHHITYKYVEVLLQKGTCYISTSGKRHFDRISNRQRLIGLSSCPQRTCRYATCAIRCKKGLQFQMENLSIWTKNIKL